MCNHSGFTSYFVSFDLGSWLRISIYNILLSTATTRDDLALAYFRFLSCCRGLRRLDDAEAVVRAEDEGNFNHDFRGRGS
jgi:hypothetical protein